MGEAAGTGAALSVIKGITPRELRENHRTELQQVMLRNDASIIGIRNKDAADKALRSRASASSTLTRLRLDQPAEAYPLASDAGLLFPVEGATGKLELLVSVNERTELIVELWDTGRAENYVPASLKTEHRLSLASGDKQWITIPVDGEADAEPHNVFLIIRANEHVSLYKSASPMSGVLAFERGTKPVVSSNLNEPQPDQPVVEWSMRSLVRQPFCFAVDTRAYGAEKVIDGYTRPYGGPHMWVSGKLEAGRNEWLELKWDAATKMSEIHLTFNDDVNEDLINLHHHETPFAVIPELVKDYDLEAWAEGEWRVLVQERGNRKRKRVHHLTEAIPATDRIRIVIRETNGSGHAELVEIRVYE
jgi:hypothetical protein